jgi:hypothetical protein
MGDESVDARADRGASGGCAADALYWGLTGFGMVSDQYPPDYGPKPDPPVCAEAYMAKRADGTDVLAYHPVRNRPGWSVERGWWVIPGGFKSG